MGKYSTCLTAMVVVLLAVAGLTMGQRSRNCDVRRSNTLAEKVNVHCDCMQKLTQMNLAIHRLTINQTGCAETGLEISWQALETKVAPEVLVLVGSHVSFAPKNSNETWNSSIKALHFIDSEIKELPANVFNGMNRLEEVRLLGSAVETIKSDAFSGLQKLKLIEFGNSTVSKIEEYAFNNLPALEDLAFAFSTIGSIDTGAISLLPTGNTQKQRCQDVGRAIPKPNEVFGDLMGRELTSVSNISFPEYGTRLVLLGNNIITIDSKAINTKNIGFLIVGRNHIVTVQSEAFQMELYNECEISAALFVGNTIDTLSSLALAGLKAKDGAQYQTFIALANNTFMTVFEQAFRLSENLSIFAVEENRFVCDCKGFGWILSEANSQIQRDLEKELVLKGTCLDGTNLLSFTSSCTDHGEPTEAAPSTVHTEGATAAPQNSTSIPQPTDIPVNPEHSSASTFSLATSILTLVICHKFF